MCRIAAYVGPPVPLSSLLYDPPHALERQAYLPREMVSGHVNVDGTGVAWWRQGETEPLRYATERPPWSDANLPALAPRLHGSPVLAVVRSATEGMGAGVENAHPFVVGGLAGSHNGHLRRFREEVAWELLDRIDTALLPTARSLTDASLLVLMVASRRRAGQPLETAVAGAAREAADIAAEAGAAAALNLVLAEADRVVGLRMARGVPANTLYLLERGERWPQGRLLASEPLDDDPGWTEVESDRLVRITASGSHELDLDEIEIPGR